jgi:uncharacterized membrane protein
MTKLADASINSFAPGAVQADFVPHSEQLITLTYGQLQDLTTQAIQKVTEPLVDRISSLEATVAAQSERIIALESTEEQDVSRLALDIAYDRQRLARLETVEPQPMQKDRAEILRALLAANGGKMLAKEARQKMHLSKQAFSNLLATMKDEIHSRPYHLDRRQVILALK